MLHVYSTCLEKHSSSRASSLQSGAYSKYTDLYMFINIYICCTPINGSVIIEASQGVKITKLSFKLPYPGGGSLYVESIANVALNKPN